MECVPGQSLADKLKSGPLPESEAGSLGAQIAAALEEAHEHGVVHRDLKPSNVMVTAKGQVKVLDFGLAKLLAPERNRRNHRNAGGNERSRRILRLTWLPSNCDGESIDARTDLWALGALLYEATTGQRPFCETLHSRLIDAILHQEPAAPRSLNPHLSRGDGIHPEKSAARKIEAAVTKPRQKCAPTSTCLKQGRAPAHSGRS